MELSDDALRSIVAHLAHLRAEYGEVLSDPELVEPTGEYFPDAFAVAPEAIEQLMRRMLTYAPLAEDLDVQLAFVEPEDAAPGGGCGSGACGPGETKAVMKGGAVETPDGYAVIVATGDAGEPKLLTASLARSAGRLVLFEADEEVDPRVEGALSELTAVGCGLGTILLNGAAVYKKGCGGMRRHQGTSLGVEELALANALFVRAAGKKPASVRRHLDVTQREAFDIALHWVDGQPRLVKALASDPASLADGIFTLEEKKGLLSRFLAAPKKDEDDVPALTAAPRPAKLRSEAELRRLAETKALVEEALLEG
ncbi:MAG: hypothetical protein JWP97_500 [Labilithrix sp.]|nr:hypothetical protein [Labilithrix sp.]